MSFVSIGTFGSSLLCASRQAVKSCHSGAPPSVVVSPGFRQAAYGESDYPRFARSFSFWAMMLSRAVFQSSSLQSRSW